MNDSQLPAEISPKHSRTQGEGDEVGKSDMKEGVRVEKELGQETGGLVGLMRNKMLVCQILLYTQSGG